MCVCVCVRPNATFEKSPCRTVHHTTMRRVPPTVELHVGGAGRRLLFATAFVVITHLTRAQVGAGMRACSFSRS